MAGPNQATVTVEYLGPSGHSTQNECVGRITPNVSVQAGGDYVLPSQFGLGTLDELYLALPGLASGAAVTTLLFPVVRSVLPKRAAQVLIQYFTDVSTEATGDQTAFSIPFIARGS
jgi:hypothetical protein